MAISSCSVHSCNNSVYDRKLLPVTKLEKEHGLMCSECIDIYYIHLANILICENCNSVVDLFKFDSDCWKFRKTNKVYYCKKCQHCGGDILDEMIYTSKQTKTKQTILQKLKQKLKKWLKQN